jgi:hypothetical protein
MRPAPTVLTTLAVLACGAACASVEREPGPTSEVAIEYLAPPPLADTESGASGQPPRGLRPTDSVVPPGARAPESSPRTDIPGVRDLADLPPALRTRALILVQRAHAEGIAVRFIFGYTRYLARTRTGPGGWATWHQFGLAFDLNLVDRRDLNDGRRHFAADAPRWRRLGAIATELGLAWGGAWRSSYDPFHFEWHPGDDAVISRDELRRFLGLAGPRGERFREVWPLYPEPPG